MASKLSQCLVEFVRPFSLSSDDLEKAKKKKSILLLFIALVICVRLSRIDL